ncbi:MAG: NTP transferase domain-containing protein, partial [Pseudomonadota bacterium]
MLLASGLSERFGSDKLMAEFRGRPLLTHAGRCLQGEQVAARLAVVGTSQTGRQALLRETGWTLVPNLAPEAGQDDSLALGIAAAARTSCKAAIVLLADMPCVPDVHIRALCDLSDDARAVWTSAGEIDLPPVLFPANMFDALHGDGLRAAKSEARRTGLR